jgi:hypothetical protein
MIPQDFHQFGGITEIIPAPVGLDIDGTTAKHIGEFHSKLIPSVAISGRFHVRSGGSVDRHPL